MLALGEIIELSESNRRSRVARVGRCVLFVAFA